MARYGKYRVKFRKNTSFMSVILATVKFVLYMYVGGLILIQIASILNLSDNPFTNAFNLLGFSGTDTVTLSSTSLIGIIGILGAVHLVVQFVQITRV